MLQCLFRSVYDLSNNFQTGDVLAFERGNATLCHSAISFRYVQLFFCYCLNHGVQNCNDYPNLVQVHIWQCQMFVLNLKSDHGNVSSDSNEDKTLCVFQYNIVKLTLTHVTSGSNLEPRTKMLVLRMGKTANLARSSRCFSKVLSCV